MNYPLNCGGERTRKNILGNLQSKMVCCKKAIDEETPDEIRNKRIKEETMIKLICDKTYSAIQTPNFNLSTPQKLMKT